MGDETRWLPDTGKELNVSQNLFGSVSRATRHVLLVEDILFDAGCADNRFECSPQPLHGNLLFLRQTYPNNVGFRLSRCARSRTAIGF